MEQAGIHTIVAYDYEPRDGFVAGELYVIQRVMSLSIVWPVSVTGHSGWEELTFSYESLAKVYIISRNEVEGLIYATLGCERQPKWCSSLAGARINCHRSKKRSIGCGLQVT